MSTGSVLGVLGACCNFRHQQCLRTSFYVDTTWRWGFFFVVCWDCTGNFCSLRSCSLFWILKGHCECVKRKSVVTYTYVSDRIWPSATRTYTCGARLTSSIFKIKQQRHLPCSMLQSAPPKQPADCTNSALFIIIIIYIPRWIEIPKLRSPISSGCWVDYCGCSYSSKPVWGCMGRALNLNDPGGSPSLSSTDVAQKWYLFL